jgi:hypothetical protein
VRRVLSRKNDSFPKGLVGPFELYLKRLDIKGSLDLLLLIPDVSELQKQWFLLADKRKIALDVPHGSLLKSVVGDPRKRKGFA